MVGIVNGVVLAAVTLVGFTRRRRARQYRYLLGVVGAATTLLALWGGRRFAISFRAAWPDQILLVLGLALAGLGGWWIGTRVARWYIAEAVGWEQE